MTRRSAFREHCFERAGFGNVDTKQYVAMGAFGAKLRQIKPNGRKHLWR
jgi:hypothetical protein